MQQSILAGIYFITVWIKYQPNPGYGNPLEALNSAYCLYLFAHDSDNFFTCKLVDYFCPFCVTELVLLWDRASHLRCKIKLPIDRAEEIFDTSFFFTSFAAAAAFCAMSLHNTFPWRQEVRR